MAAAAVGGRGERLSSSSPTAAAPQVDAGKYVRYTPEQVEALERVYTECPKPSSLRRQQLLRECPILSNIEPKQIKVWFQNRRSVSSPSLSSICFCSGLFSSHGVCSSVSFLGFV
jgi:homeobox-leucine zipper protein